MMTELGARSVVLLLAAAVIVRIWGRLPAGRHLVWSLSLAGLLVLPLTTVLVPPLRLGLLPAGSGDAPTVVGRSPAVPTREGAGTPDVPAPGPPAATHLEATSRPHPLALLWLGGAVVLLARLAWERVYLAGVGRWGSRPSASLAREAEALARRMGLRRPVRLLKTPRIDVPSTWGTLRPILAIPPGFGRWEPARRRRILLHELAHVRRCDAAWGLLGEIATSLYWWNPLAWHAARSARAASEAAADASVLEAGARPSDYARDLLAVARHLARSPWARSLHGIGQGRLRERIETVLEWRSPPLPRRPVIVVLGTLTVLQIATVATVLPVRAARPVESAPSARSGNPLAVATPPWPAHQVRWAHGGEAGALFLEGDVDLARLVREGELPTPSGLLVWFHRGAAGSWEHFAAGQTGGAPWVTGRRDGGQRPGPAMDALRRSLVELAPDWRDHPDTSIGSLAALPELAGEPVLDFSGSIILGVPGKSRDPRTGVLQAGWYQNGERIGVFTRGPLDLGSDGRSLERLPGDGWLAAFGWVPATGRLRIVEALPGPGGRPVLRYTDDGVERPLDSGARQWLGRVLAALPGREPGATRVSWRD